MGSVGDTRHRACPLRRSRISPRSVSVGGGPGGGPGAGAGVMNLVANRLKKMVETQNLISKENENLSDRAHTDLGRCAHVVSEVASGRSAIIIEDKMEHGAGCDACMEAMKQACNHLQKADSTLRDAMSNHSSIASHQGAASGPDILVGGKLAAPPRGEGDRIPRRVIPTSANFSRLPGLW